MTGTASQRQQRKCRGRIIVEVHSHKKAVCLHHLPRLHRARKHCNSPPLAHIRRPGALPRHAPRLSALRLALGGAGGGRRQGNWRTLASLESRRRRRPLLPDAFPSPRFLDGEDGRRGGGALVARRAAAQSCAELHVSRYDQLRPSGEPSIILVHQQFL